MGYNYREEMAQDIKEYIRENESEFEGLDIDELRDKLYDDLWTVDSVTGNASGSYTFNSFRAEEYIKDNLDLLGEAYEELSTPEDLGRELIDQNYENMDVTIRCYLLYQVIDEVLEDTDLLLPANKKFIGDDEDEEFGDITL